MILPKKGVQASSSDGDKHDYHAFRMNFDLFSFWQILSMQ